jgi:hypothetical protein
MAVDTAQVAPTQPTFIANAAAIKQKLLTSSFSEASTFFSEASTFFDGIELETLTHWQQRERLPGDFAPRA